MALDNSPICGEAAGYYTASIDYSCFIDKFRNDLDFRTFLNNLFHVPAEDSVAFSLISGTLFFMLGEFSEKIAVSTNILYLLILVLSTFFIGSYMFNRQIGLISSIFVGLYPLVFGFSRVYMRDLAGAAFVALTFLFLYLSEGFLKRKWSFCAGLSLGLALLIRVNTAFFLAGPIIYMFVSKLRSKESRKNFLIFCVSVIIFAGWWYIPNFRRFLLAYLGPHHYTWGFSSFGERFKLPNLLHYSYSLFSSPGRFFLLFLAFSFVRIIASKSYRDERLRLFFILMISGWLLTFLLPVRDERFFLPLSFSFALISGFGICSMPWKTIRKYLISIGIGGGIIQYLLLSYLSLFNNNAAQALGEILYPPVRELKEDLCVSLTKGLTFPTRERLLPSYIGILETAKERNARNVMLMPPHGGLDSPLAYLSKIYQYDIEFWFVDLKSRALNGETRNLEFILEKIKDSDLILTSLDYVKYIEEEKITNQDLLDILKNSFRPIRNLSISHRVSPGNDDLLVLYQNTKKF